MVIRFAKENEILTTKVFKHRETGNIKIINLAVYEKAKPIHSHHEEDPWHMRASDIQNVLENCNTLLWAHSDGLSLEKYNNSKKLKKNTTIIAIGEEPTNNLKFVGILKYNGYPYYSYQFHPEKNGFERKAGGIYENLDRSPQTVQVLNGLFTKLVSDSLTRRNRSKYEPFPEKFNIFNSYNFVPIPYIGNVFDQVYYFMDLTKNCKGENIDCKKYLGSDKHEDSVWKLHLEYRNAVKAQKK